MSELSPGYYPDPDKAGYMKYWNGREWAKPLVEEPEILPQEPKVSYQIVNSKKVMLEEFEGSDLQIFLTTNKRTKNIFNKLTKLYFLCVDPFSDISRSDRKVILGQYSPEVAEMSLLRKCRIGY